MRPTRGISPVPYESPDFLHGLLLPSFPGLTKAQEAEESGEHDVAAVEQETGVEQS